MQKKMNAGAAPPMPGNRSGISGIKITPPTLISFHPITPPAAPPFSITGFAAPPSYQTPPVPVDMNAPPTTAFPIATAPTAPAPSVPPIDPNTLLPQAPVAEVPHVSLLKRFEAWLKSL